MKKVIFALALLLTTLAVSAQSSLLGTLSHDGTITSYYGVNALKDAYNAAVDGDVITLSSGQFNAVDIRKAIVIRGAGMFPDSISGAQPTVISGDFTLYSPAETSSHKLVLEGLYHNSTIYYDKIYGVQVVKCRISKFIEKHNAESRIGVTFIQSRVADILGLALNCAATCINSYIKNPYSNYDTSNFVFINCVINNTRNVKNSTFNDCLIYDQNSLSSSCTAYHCIAFGNSNSTYFTHMTNTTNKVVSGYGMFKTFRGDWTDNADFELTDAAKEAYKGVDGTEIGIYGGMLPYDTTPSNPQITKFNVASRSTADGKLSVDIEVGLGGK